MKKIISSPDLFVGQVVPTSLETPVRKFLIGLNPKDIEDIDIVDETTKFLESFSLAVEINFASNIWGRDTGLFKSNGNQLELWINPHRPSHQSTAHQGYLKSYPNTRVSQLPADIEGGNMHIGTDFALVGSLVWDNMNDIQDKDGKLRQILGVSRLIKLPQTPGPLWHIDIFSILLNDTTVVLNDFSACYKLEKRLLEDTKKLEKSNRAPFQEFVGSGENLEACAATIQHFAKTINPSHKDYVPISQENIDDVTNALCNKLETTATAHEFLYMLQDEIRDGNFSLFDRMAFMFVGKSILRKHPEMDAVQRLQSSLFHFYSHSIDRAIDFIKKNNYDATECWSNYLQLPYLIESNSFRFCSGEYNRTNVYDPAEKPQSKKSTQMYIKTLKELSIFHTRSVAKIEQTLVDHHFNIRWARGFFGLFPKHGLGLVNFMNAVGGLTPNNEQWIFTTGGPEPLRTAFLTDLDTAIDADRHIEVGMLNPKLSTSLHLLRGGIRCRLSPISLYNQKI